MHVYNTCFLCNNIFFFHLTVPPVITTPPSVGQAVVGQQYRFECQASGKPAPEYLWFKVICAFLD